MPSWDFNSDSFHKGRVRTVRIGDIVLDAGVQEFKGYQVQVVVTAGARTVDRSNWFQEMIFGSQSEEGESDREVA